MCYGELINTLLKPKETAKTVGKWDLAMAFKAVVAGALIPAIIVFIMVAAIGVLALPFSPIVGALGIGGALIAAISIIILWIINWLIAAFIIWIVGKVLGSKVGYIDFAVPYAAVVGAIAMLAWIPIINILVFLYGLYLAYIWIMEHMKLDSDKAVLTVIGTIIVGIIIAAILWFTGLTMSLMGMGLTQMVK